EIILVTGPTGSGKTTTLYGALNLINSVDKNIITVEDPVEYELMGVNQVQTNLKAGRTFASSLRSILRQDPDVIMIGEIRDAETAEIATQAALTGHLVLSTLHTNDASGAISRLVEMGIPPFLIASSLGLVLSQRLLRRLCLHCRQKYEMAATLRQDFGLTVEQAASCYQSVGCNECDHSGYRGRVAIYEVFAMSKEIERLIMANASSRDIYRQAMAEGLVSLRQAGINKMLEGLTSASEVYRVSMEEME
ncbi:MAG: GspE/PulE family protein, partial [Desulfobulbaceae bacterium]|nr:GspE/PulE family protein [Desulfobulbaceae bacterium]